MLKNLLKRFSWENVLLDGSLVAVEWYFFSTIVAFFKSHLLLFFWIGIGVHFIGMGTGMYVYACSKEEKSEKRTWLRKITDNVEGISFMFSWFSFTWLLFPLFALEKISGKEFSGFGWIMLLLIFFSLIAGAWGGSRGEEDSISSKSKNPLLIRLLTTLLVGFFIFYSEALIQASAMTGMMEPAQKYGAFFWTFISFFPLRFMLFYRTPMSLFELLSMSGSFGYFMMRIVKIMG